jgi:integrative and conjugative element protein (TIGR02256 family)
MTGDLVFLAPDGGRFVITPLALQTMQSFAQRGPHDAEAGGVMVGRFIEGGNDVVVDLVTPPLPGDRRSRCRFHRRAKPHQAVLNREWKTSGGVRTYLGEWHTHPESFPTPSSIDIRDWRRRVRRDSFHGDTLRFVIVGLVEVRAWLMERPPSCSTGWHSPSLMKRVPSSELKEGRDTEL